MSWTHQSALNVDYDSEKELGEDTGFLENFNVAYDHEQAENLSNSESIVMVEDVNNAYAALHEYTGQARFDTLSNYGNEVAGFDIDLRDLDAEQDLIIKLRQQHPNDTRLRTYSQMIADKKPELDALRERSQDVYDRAGVMGTVGTFLGTMGAHVKDPMFMYSLAFGAGPTTAKTALGRAVQVGAKEAAIAGVAEVPVSVSRYQWKEKIESPWTVWDAAEETLMVMTGTGLLSGVGYAIGDALGWTHAAKVARENGLEGEAQILEKRAKIIEESEAQGVPVEEVLDARTEAESQMGTHSNGNDKSYVSWDIENDPIFDEDGFESAGEDYALIEKIYVPEADRSNGVGRRILRESIHEIQQQHPDMPIKIAAYPFGDNALDMEDLVNFYESEGFDVVNTDGHAVIMEHDGSIVARPNSAKNTPKESTVIYHGTSETFDDFDLDKTADGTVWFTDNKALIDSGEVGASGQGQVIERVIDEDKLKLAGWDENDKFSTGELIDQGYDGLKLVEDDQTTYRIFDPTKLSKVGESPSKYNADLEVPGAPILEGGHRRFFNASTVDHEPDGYLEPHVSNWVEEVAGGVELPADEITSPLVYLSENTDWVTTIVGRKIGKSPQDVTVDDIREHGRLNIIDADLDDDEIFHVGEYSQDESLTDLKGNRRKFYDTPIYDEGDIASGEGRLVDLPMGPETDDWISNQALEVKQSLTGDELIKYMFPSEDNIKAVPVEGKYNADLEVPGTPTLKGSEITATVRSYAEVMEEFDAEEQIWKDFETCMVGLADGE